MTIELIKQLLDACYLAKRAREMLPALPEGVTSSYIQCLDVIQKLQTRGIQPKISDLSDALNLPRPGVTRTVKEMEHKGYLRKQVSAEDGRVTYLFLTESGKRFPRSTIRTTSRNCSRIWTAFPRRMQRAPSKR